MEAEKVLIQIEGRIEQLRRLGVFMDTGAADGQMLIAQGLHKIRLSVEQQAARDEILLGKALRPDSLGDELE